MRNGTHIWVIEDNSLLAARISDECPDVVVTAVACEEIARRAPAPGLVVVDAADRPSASTSIGEIRRRHPVVPVLVVAPAATCEPLPPGIDDFIVVPFQPGELRMRVARLSGLRGAGARALQEDAPVREIRSRYRLDGVIGGSAQLLDAIRKVPRFGASEANVLITGETGTGKELFARAIHYASGRHDQPFIPVNCGALPETLFENELFGHQKGAYTGAFANEVGLLAVAERGSLFLDEIDSLSPASQAKLLRVLQDREYRPVGAQHARKADVRVIAAANSPLADRIAGREFRADLYYRLNVLALRLPALAERREDIPALVRHFVRRFAGECRRRPPAISPEAMYRLQEYGWPGNVRELESVVNRAVVLSDEPELDAACFDLPDSWAAAAPPRAGLSITDAVHEFERQYLAGLLSRQSGNVSRAAQAAGKDRRTFQRLLRRHGFAAQSAE